MKQRLYRVFFYSSRQLRRRWRAYLSIFLTSVVLLTLVMTYLEMAESLFLRQNDQTKSGAYHASIRGVLYDYTDDIAAYRKVSDVWTIPYTSRMASSDDTSYPARVVTPTPEIYDRLNVHYLWGREPQDGEIAVSTELFNAYTYLTAGEINDLYFTASQMTYFPLRISGIYDCNDKHAGYVFVTPETARQIDAETGAVEYFDTYLRCRYNSDNNVATVVKQILEDLSIPKTVYQKRRVSGENSPWWRIKDEYREYINTSYLENLKNYQAAPILPLSLPVIIAAALMLASFVSNWMTSNSAEYGILGAIGATRRQLCAIASGQVLLITLVAIPPVLIFSALLANTYISVFNAASSTDVDFLYKIPFAEILAAALWFCVLSCFFSYLGIANLTRKPAFVLISGSYRAKMPFVKKTSTRILRAKDKIAAVSFITALRNIRSGILSAIVSSLICIVCGAFLIILIMFKSDTVNKLINYEKHETDIRISAKVDTVFGRRNSVTAATVAQITQIDGIQSAAGYAYLSRPTFTYDANRANDSPGESLTYHVPCLKTSEDFEMVSSLTADNALLPLICGNIKSGDIASLEPGQVIVVCEADNYEDMTFQAGDTLDIASTVDYFPQSGRMRYGETESFEIAAVVTKNNEQNDININSLFRLGFLFTLEDAERLYDIHGYDGILCRFDENLSDEQKLAITDAIYGTPSLLRYEIESFSVLSTSQKQIDFANTLLIVVFFGMLYLSFCVMTYTDAFLKITKSRADIAVQRQLGATNREIYKSVRIETYPISLLSVAITIVLFLILIYGYISYQTSNLAAMADQYPITFSPEVVAEHRAQIFQMAGMISLLGLSALPMHALSAAVRILGTILPTRRALSLSIVEGIRKDTD